MTRVESAGGGTRSHIPWVLKSNMGLDFSPRARAHLPREVGTCGPQEGPEAPSRDGGQAVSTGHFPGFTQTPLPFLGLMSLRFGIMVLFRIQKSPENV